MDSSVDRVQRMAERIAEREMARSRLDRPGSSRCGVCRRKRKGCLCCEVTSCVAPARVGSDYCAYHGRDRVAVPRKEVG